MADLPVEQYRKWPEETPIIELELGELSWMNVKPGDWLIRKYPWRYSSTRPMQVTSTFISNKGRPSVRLSYLNEDSERKDWGLGWYLDRFKKVLPPEETIHKYSFYQFSFDFDN